MIAVRPGNWEVPIASNFISELSVELIREYNITFFRILQTYFQQKTNIIFRIIYTQDSIR